MTPIEKATAEAEGFLDDARKATGSAQALAFTKARAAFTKAARLATEARDLSAANALMARANQASDQANFAQKAALDQLAKMKAKLAVGKAKRPALSKWAGKSSND